jgi:hypothetical protein
MISSIRRMQSRNGIGKRSCGMRAARSGGLRNTSVRDDRGPACGGPLRSRDGLFAAGGVRDKTRRGLMLVGGEFSTHGRQYRIAC